jgi:HK97 gp10 family phage protein
MDLGKPPAGSGLVLHVEPVGNNLQITFYAAQDDAFYLRFHEFGTRNMAARPFFFPAYRSNRKRASSRIKSAIRRAVKDVMAGKLSIGADE